MLTHLAMSLLLGVAGQDAAAIAGQILDDSQPAEQRQALIRKHPELAAELVAAMAEGIPQDNEKEEYRRIPWIWRVAIAEGKRNQIETLRKLVEVSLPKHGDELRHWQAVVLGGGVINGISQAGRWPKQRIDELLRSDESLMSRWKEALVAAARMADDQKVPHGTRYDALRMVALAEGADGRSQLARYLAKGTNAELQMGAVSGLSDIDAPETAPLLLSNLKNLTAGNRALAIDALLRTDERAAALLTALEKGEVKSGFLTAAQIQALSSLKDETLQARAKKVLAKEP